MPSTIEGESLTHLSETSNPRSEYKPSDWSELAGVPSTFRPHTRKQRKPIDILSPKLENFEIPSC